MTAALEFERRVEPGTSLIEEADAIARACADMARRFHAGGKLIVFGNGAAATDAAHVEVEFVHPVIVGKRALPAMSLSNDASVLTGLAEEQGLAGVYAAQLRLVADPGDIAVGICGAGPAESVQQGLAEARRLGLLTVALTGGLPDGGGSTPLADHVLPVRSDDPQIVKEIQVTIYHVLWELVHVFLEQPGVLAGGEGR